MRSWSTFKIKPKWTEIQNKPTILADNQISLDEVVNHPFTYQNSILSVGAVGTPHYSSPNATTIVLKGYASNRSLLELHSGDATVKGAIQSVSGGGFMIGSLDTSPLQLFANRIVAIQINSLGNVGIVNVPISAAGLAIGTIYKDTNGFLKIV